MYWATIEYKSEWSQGRRVKMILAQDVERMSTEDYTNRVPEGITILDNGANEGKLLPFDEYVHMINRVKPTVVVLPDILYNAEATLYIGKEFMDYYWKGKPSKVYPQFMTVLQASADDDVVDVLETYIKIRTPWVGLPRRMGSIKRLAVARAISRLGLQPAHSNLHALGLYHNTSSDITQEARELAAIGNIFSVDSDRPVREGWADEMDKICQR